MLRSVFPVLLIFMSLKVPFTSAQQKVLFAHPDTSIHVCKLKITSSSYRESHVAVSPDGNTLFFTSERGGQPWSHHYLPSYGKDSTYDKDIWFTERQQGVWSAPECLPHGINTSLGEDEPFVSPDGKTLYFQSWNYMWNLTGGPYYSINLRKLSRPKPKGFDRTFTRIIGEFVSTGGFSITPDGRDMYLAARKSSDSNMNIYRLRRKGRKWKVMGKSPLSTYGREASVFIAADGKTIYFSSDGYEGMGGLDIYKTTLDEKGRPGVIIHLGPEINSEKDEYCWTITRDGNEGYFIRDGNIYHVDFRNADPTLRF